MDLFSKFWVYFLQNLYVFLNFWNFFSMGVKFPEFPNSSRKQAYPAWGQRTQGGLRAGMTPPGLEPRVAVGGVLSPKHPQLSSCCCLIRWLTTSDGLTANHHSLDLNLFFEEEKTSGCKL
jgi:hypothetical protein